MEVLMHKWFSGREAALAGVTTDDPNEASLFFIPFYASRPGPRQHAGALGANYVDKRPLLDVRTEPYSLGSGLRLGLVFRV